MRPYELLAGIPPWEAVVQETQRWITAGCYAAIIDDLCLPGDQLRPSGDLVHIGGREADGRPQA